MRCFANLRIALFAASVVAYGSGQAVAQRQPEEPAAALPRIRVDPSGLGFVAGAGDQAEKFVVWGVNYDHDGDGRLLEDYWEDEWATVVEDFREIRDLGANVVRVHLQIGRFMDSPDTPNPANLARLAELVRLAETTGLYLDVTGLGCYHKDDVPEWYDALGESDRWEVQAEFWTAVATACRDSAAVFCYDLMNEPVVVGGGGEGWLPGEFGGKYFVQRIALELGERTSEEIAGQWVAKLTSSIRRVDPEHLVTVGVIPWAYTFKGAKPLFYGPGVGDSLDFVSVHFYPEKGDTDGALAALEVYEIGKPLVVEEMFPLKCSAEELIAFVGGSRGYCDGWVSFYWGKTIEENAAEETIQGALVAEWLRQFKLAAPRR